MEQPNWCCFWDSTDSNLLAVGLHGILSSMIYAAQCASIYFFALEYAQVVYLPRNAAPVKRRHPNWLQSHEVLFQKIQAADWAKSGKGGVATLKNQVIKTQHAAYVLDSWHEDYLVYPSATMFWVNVTMLIVSLLFLVLKVKPRRITLLLWLIFIVIYIVCDCCYHLLLIYALLFFPKLDMISGKTWFHFVSAMILVIAFIRVSVHAYSIMYVKDFRSKLSVAPIKNIANKNERSSPQQFNPQDPNRNRIDPVKRIVMMAAKNDKSSDSLSREVNQLRKINIEMAQQQRNVLRRKSFFTIPMGLPPPSYASQSAEESFSFSGLQPSYPPPSEIESPIPIRRMLPQIPPQPQHQRRLLPETPQTLQARNVPL